VVNIGSEREGRGGTLGLRRFVAGVKGGDSMVNCPLCDAVIDVDEEELDEGDSLLCEECGANLNVSGVSPLELSKDTGDDDEDDDEDEDEEELDEDLEEEDEDEEDEDWK
jgi:alpha-aminoadipate/glutamate carrier protein LysW